MRITVNRAVCVGAGQCATLAEELFDQDDDGIVVLLDEAPGPGQHSAARRAVSLCPARAITIVDE